MTAATNADAAPSRSPRERRRNPRLACDGTAHVRVPNVEARATGTVTNLSLAGCYIEFSAPFNITYGQRLEILFNVNQLPFRVMGCARVVHPRKGIGVEFTDISHRGRQQLCELIRELEDSSEDPPAAATTS